MSYFVFEEKEVFYEVSGEGEPLLMLHGNTASSALFDDVVPFFATRGFRVVTFDFPGHGKSARLESFPDDFWHHNARAAIALCEHLGLEKVNVVGTSGGAIVALNMAIAGRAPVARVIADSFMGYRINLEDALGTKEAREEAKKHASADFWKYTHGDDWEAVVDMDTDMLIRVAEKGGRMIVGDLRRIDCPVLFTGSLRDEMIQNIEVGISVVAREIEDATVVLLSRGSHPLMLGRSAEFLKIALGFLGGA